MPNSALGSRRSFSALDLLAQEPHARQPGKRDGEGQEKKRRPRESQILRIGRIAGGRTDPKYLGLSWATFFFLAFTIALPGLACVWFLRKEIERAEAASTS